MATALTIDDSRVVLMKMNKLLSDKGFQVLTASSGEEGVQVLKDNLDKDLNLVFIDFNMPGIDGIETAKLIIEMIDSNRVFLLTANIQPAIQEKAKSIGVSFLEKPLTEDTLSKIVKAG